MGLDKYRENRSFSCLSRVDTLGAFDFYNYMISLDSIQPHHLQQTVKASAALGAGNPLSVDQFHAADKVFSLAFHEYTHFLDTSSTLWGLRYLQLLDAGYQAYGHPDGEAHFPAAKQLHDFGRSIGWPAYYTEQYGQGDPAAMPWRAEVTGGSVFDARGRLTDRPIVFVRFSDARDAPLVRSPLSTVSVLEASAMAQELNFRIGVARNLGEFEQLVEMRDIQKKTLDFIYDPRFTEYSVCAHLFANEQQCTDVMVAYSCLAVLTRWVLNVPRLAIRVILEHAADALQQINGWAPGSETTELVIEAVRQHDIGGLFYLLVIGLPPGANRSPAALADGIQVSLARLGLDAEQVRAWAYAEATQTVQALSASSIEQVRTLAEAGIRNYRAIPWDRSILPMSDLHLPQVLLGDAQTFVHLFDNPVNVLRGYDVSRSYTELFPREKWVHKFAQACF